MHLHRQVLSRGLLRHERGLPGRHRGVDVRAGRWHLQDVPERPDLRLRRLQWMQRPGLSQRLLQRRHLRRDFGYKLRAGGHGLQWVRVDRGWLQRSGDLHMRFGRGLRVWASLRRRGLQLHAQQLRQGLL